jgi:hypothetical protein
MAASAARPGYLHSILTHYRTRPISSILVSVGAIGFGWAGANYQLKDKGPPRLNPTHFTPYTLVATHTVSSTSAIFTLRPPRSAVAAQELSKTWNESQQLWSVQAKQPHLQIGREYTPLPPSDVLNSATQASILSQDDVDPSSQTPTASAADIHLLIRREKMGTMTRYLHGLPLNAPVGLRGPYYDLDIPPEVDEILFLAGGTGISPALQVANILSRRSNARMHVLWANRRRDECVGVKLAHPPSGNGFFSSLWGSTPKKSQEPAVLESGEKGLVVKVIEEMKAKNPPGKFNVKYFVDEDDSFIGQKDVQKVIHARSVSSIGGGASEQKPGSKLIIVSGPDGFVDYWAGKKRVSREGLEVQGPLGGRLGQLDLNGWNVLKL